MKVIYFLLFILFFSCSQKQNQGIIDPNKASDMALMMREMYIELTLIKDKLEKSQDISREKLHFDLIHKKKPTDSIFLTDNLGFMSVAFSESINTFNKTPSKETFSNVVNHCISCHQNLCPGPLESILSLKR